jgi:hypothetical protein
VTVKIGIEQHKKKNQHLAKKSLKEQANRKSKTARTKSKYNTKIQKKR